VPASSRCWKQLWFYRIHFKILHERVVEISPPLPPRPAFRTTSVGWPVAKARERENVMLENREPFFFSLPLSPPSLCTRARYQLIALTGQTVKKFVANYLTRRACDLLLTHRRILGKAVGTMSFKCLDIKTMSILSFTLLKCQRSKFKPISEVKNNILLSLTSMWVKIYYFNTKRVIKKTITFKQPSGWIASK